MLDSNPAPMNGERSSPCIFYTVFETAQTLGVALSTVYDLHHEGKLTIKKIGKKSVILRSDVDAYVKSIDLPRGPDPTRGVGRFHPRRKKKPAEAAATTN